VFPEQGGNPCHELAGEVDLGRGRQRLLAVIIEKNQLVLVTAKTIVDQVADDQGDPLAAPLAFCVLVQVFAFGSEADA
jgi:hypothetical protein